MANIKCAFRELVAGGEVKPCKGRVRKVDPRLVDKDLNDLTFFSCEKHWEQVVRFARGEE